MMIIITTLTIIGMMDISSGVLFVTSLSTLGCAVGLSSESLLVSFTSLIKVVIVVFPSTCVVVVSGSSDVVIIEVDVSDCVIAGGVVVEVLLLVLVLVVVVLVVKDVVGFIFVVLVLDVGISTLTFISADLTDPAPLEERNTYSSISHFQVPESPYAAVKVIPHSLSSYAPWNWTLFSIWHSCMVMLPLLLFHSKSQNFPVGW